MEKTHAVESLHLDGLGAMPLHRLRRHAEQLATHLSAIATDLDRREAELAAERFRQDAMQRSVRLWIDTRVGQMHEVVMQLQQQAADLQTLARQVVSGQPSPAAEEQLDQALATCSHQLITLDKQLLGYEPVRVQPNPQSDSGRTLSGRSAALDLRERSLKREQIALAEAYQETMEIRDSAETLLHDAVSQKSTAAWQGESSRDAALLHAQTQALQEAEQRLRMLYSEVTADQSKTRSVRKMETPSWVHERQALVGEIDRLQAELEKYSPDATSRNAA